MIYKKLPWSSVIFNLLLQEIHEIIEKEDIFNEQKFNVTYVSQDMKQLILRMLTIDY